MSAEKDWVPDELDRRIRALEAERLRPIPPAPIMQRRPSSALEAAVLRREAHDLHILEEHMAEVERRRKVLEELDEADDEDGT